MQVIVEWSLGLDKSENYVIKHVFLLDISISFMKDRK